MSILRSFQRRQGAAAVEASLVMPVLVGVTLMAVDISQYIALAQTVSNASRVGARFASRADTNTVQEVEEKISSYIQCIYPSLSDQQVSSATKIDVTDADGNQVSSGDLTTISSGEPIAVQVQFDFNSIRWLGGLEYWSGDVNISQTVSRRE